MNRRRLMNWLRHHRCARCGLLGAVAGPNSSRALPDLGEVAAQYRRQWMHKLKDARDRKHLRGSEYDPVMGQDLGIDKSTPFGVMCGIGRPEGPRGPMFFVPGEGNEDMAYATPGYIIREPDPSSRSPFGRVVAVVQTHIWPLVQPHTCPRFRRYRDGLSPAQHIDEREGVRRWRRDLIAALIGIVVGAFLQRLLG